MSTAVINYIEDLISEKYEETTKRDCKYDIGYPMNLKGQDIHGQYKGEVAKSLPFLLNYTNPLVYEPAWMSNSSKQEGELIKELIHPWGGRPDNTWGYITSGGSESNLAALKFALKKFKPIKPILLFSTETHHSIIKFLDLCEHSFEACVICPTKVDGQMDYTKIKEMMKPFYTESTPVVVIATLGTTMKGATDDIIEIRDELLQMGVKKRELYVHADAALSGGFWYLDGNNYPYQLGREINSVSISGYKWYGCDVCSLFAYYQGEDLISSRDYFEVVKSNDLGIGGARNGFNSISWRIRLKQFDWQAEYDTCVKMVDLAKSKFEELGMETLVNPQSITVCFPKPPQEIITKYALATSSDKHLGNIAHIIILPHVTEDVIESFCKDISEHLDDMELSFTR